MTPLLSVRQLCQHFTLKNRWFAPAQQLYAVDNVSFELTSGQTLGIVGESGCGKSTLARTLLHLYEPTSGEVEFIGQSLNALNQSQLRAMRQQMQMVFQDPAESLNPRHNVGQILTEPFVIHGQGNHAQRRLWAQELLQQVGLQSEAIYRYPHEFSGGQRQRISIARAIALKPKLLICDEAVSALDVSVQAQIVNLLLQLQQQMGLSMIFIAHDLTVVKHLSDKIAVMYLGRIVELADAEQLYQAPRHPYSQALLAAIAKPDPRQRRTFAPLAGEVPSPINPPTGCHFHPRCPYRQVKCTAQVPTLKGSAIHQVACHFPLSAE